MMGWRRRAAVGAAAVGVVAAGAVGVANWRKLPYISGVAHYEFHRTFHGDYPYAGLVDSVFKERNQSDLAPLAKALINTENRFWIPNMVTANKNGSRDLGLGAVNSVTAESLASKYGVKLDLLNPRDNVTAMALLLGELKQRTLARYGARFSGLSPRQRDVALAYAYHTGEVGIRGDMQRKNGIAYAWKVARALEENAARGSIRGSRRR